MKYFLLIKKNKFFFIFVATIFGKIGDGRYAMLGATFFGKNEQRWGGG
jgi:hypothetical protein